jgi:glucose/arabinose dehydrogenase
MRQIIVFGLILAVSIFVIKTILPFRGTLPAILPPKNLPEQNSATLALTVSPGWNISVFAERLVDPRVLIRDSNGTILVSTPAQGRVIALPDGQAKVVLEGLNRPHGLALAGNKLYVAEENQVAVYDYDPNNLTASNKKKILDLPAGGRHTTRSLLIRDSKLYVSIGSSCDVCEEKDSRRASVLVANLDGSDSHTFASGLRNTVFITINPKTNEIWGTDMGRDFLGDNLPPDEINILKEGQNFGWPICYGKNVHDTNFDKKTYITDPCSSAVASHIDIPAHSAPLGLAFLGNDLLVAYHGSWNRSTPTGYKIVRFKLDSGGQLAGVEDFVTGWLTSDLQVLGRPAGILVLDEKTIYVSDDKSGVVYLLTAS